MGIEQATTHFAEENHDSTIESVGGERSVTRRRRSDIELPRDAQIDNLIALLSRPTEGLTDLEYRENTDKRQDAVNKFLVRGGSEGLRRLFGRVKQLEQRESLKLDLSMLEVSGRILSGLYLPGANLEKLIFTLSDISGSELTAARLVAVLAPRSIMRGVIAPGTDWTDGIIPKADMSGGRFIASDFTNTDMTGAIVDRDTNFAGAIFIGTKLGGVDMSLPNTTGAVFRGIRR
jgi:hypothetical protein